MESASKLREKIVKIVDIARYAPSVHNAQPWKVSVDKNSIRVDVSPSHSLKFSDPTGRETIISLGIFSEALVLGAAAHGFVLKEASLSSGGSVLEFVHSDQKIDPAIKGDVRSLKTRCTDRSIFEPVQISAAAVRKIENSSSIKGATVKVVVDKKIISKIADLTSRGISLALGSPDFRRELSGYLTLPWSHSKRGISVLSLRIPMLLAVMEPHFIRWGIGLGEEVKTEKRRWLSASGIIFITTAGDVKNDWFQAGRAYLRTALAAEHLGLAQATSAATVEASTFHEDVEDILNTKQRLQSATRIGRGSNKKIYSPRVSASELLAT